MTARRARMIIRNVAAGALVLPGAACAMGPHDVVYASDPVFDAVFLLGPLGLTWAVHAVSRWLAVPQPPLRFASIAAVVLALWLAMIGLFVVPAYGELFSSFGMDLPAPTLILNQFPYVLVAPAVVVAAAQWLLRRHPSRGRYIAAIATAESLILVLVYFSLFALVYRETVAE